jgi:uridine kinase
MKLKIVCFSDLHCTGTSFQKTIAAFQKAMDTCKKVIKPDMVVLLGDLATDGDVDKDRAHLDKISSLMGMLDMPYFVIRGNKDIDEKSFYSYFKKPAEWHDFNGYRMVFFLNDVFQSDGNAIRENCDVEVIARARFNYSGMLMALQHISFHNPTYMECPYNLLNYDKVLYEMQKNGVLLSVGAHWHQGYTNLKDNNQPACIISPAFRDGYKYLVIELSDTAFAITEKSVQMAKLEEQGMQSSADAGQQFLPLKYIIKRSGVVVPYDRDRIRIAIFRAMAVVKRGNNELAEQLSARVEEKLIANYGESSTPSVEEIQDMVEQTLHESGEEETAKAYSSYRQQRALARATRHVSFEVTDNIPYKKIYEVLRWNIEHSCSSIDELNELIEAGRFGELIAETDTRFEQEIDQCFSAMMGDKMAIKLVIISGPSSSGKTTTTIKLSERFAREGLRFRALTVDNYFFDIEKHPKDEFGDYDYETPYALDLELINEHIARLLAGETVYTPYYSFKTGKRTLNALEMRLEKNEILLLDSLHGLFEEMTKLIPAHNKFKLYVETLGQLKNRNGLFMRWADHRLMRRMIRDSLHRNSTPEMTITHWHYVRRSELKYIIPFIGTADFLINTALPYEMPILKGKLFHYFPAAMQHYRNDPARQDAYIRAKRIYEFLQPLKSVEEDSCVPQKSLLREFIGGSAYKY